MKLGVSIFIVMLSLAAGGRIHSRNIRPGGSDSAGAREREMECSNPPGNNQVGIQRGTTTPTAFNRWPKNQLGYVNIPYEIDSSLGNKGRRAVEMTKVYYNRYTCINLVPRTSEANYINFRDLNDGCWSYVGMIGGKQDIQLQENGCAYSMGTPLHELGHAIGILHEQSRPDRDSYVRINWENIETGYENNFQKEDSTVINSNGSPYDFLSMMQYGGYAFSKNNLPTIEKLTTPSTIVSQRNGFSSIDITQINDMYQCGGVNMGNQPTTECYHTSDQGLSYRGTVAVAADGRPCQQWSNHISDFSFHHDFGLDSNYCRIENAIYDTKPSCIVGATTGGYLDWAECAVPECNVEPTPSPPEDCTSWSQWSAYGSCQCVGSIAEKERTRTCLAGNPTVTTETETMTCTQDEITDWATEPANRCHKRCLRRDNCDCTYKECKAGLDACCTRKNKPYMASCPE